MRKFLGASFTVAVLYLLVAVAHGDQKRATGKPFIQNGDFEDVKIAAPFMSKNPADVPGWTHSQADPGDGLIWRIGYADAGGTITKAGHGSQFVTLGGGYYAAGSPSWSTTISGLTPGKTYQLSFMLANENLGTPQTITVAFISGSSTPAQSYTVQPGQGYWTLWESKTQTFTATAATAQVKFSVANMRYDIGLDNVSVSVASQQFSVKEEAGKIGITLNDAVLFDFNKYDLKPAAEAVLAEIKSTIIDKHPSGKVVVEGYTDDVGGDAYNLELSDQRAKSVAAWLQQHGLESSRLKTQGYGKARPKFPNNSSRNRAKNRRVEINVIE
ncbi:MAG TPA: OmpA family protein [Terriglobales bacterium]|nr:OmpA family protein [Terriglobales bacterium]